MNHMLFCIYNYAYDWLYRYFYRSFLKRKENEFKYYEKIVKLSFDNSYILYNTCCMPYGILDYIILDFIS